MKTNEIRRKFIDFFVSKGHQEVASSSLLPANDPTLLFTNAGMNQFKDCFLGLEKRAYQRATTSQKCVRAGGKHNDLENVGFTARHHTFFEMLGNFSFGDYFKLDAIKYAWELLTKVYQLPEEKLLVTIYHTDDEAFKIWNEVIGVPAEKIIRIGDKEDGSSDNFWQMGDTGPCGPCSEIFYDHGDHIWGGPPGSAEEDGDRFIEIWNLVFMQFNRDESGELHPLPNPSIDTGMGLERIAAILQNVHSNYEIDLFVKLIKASAEAVGTKDLDSSSLKVLSDHIRSVAFLIADGILPSNEGRGYVLRRIIRRAIRHGYKLGQKELFFYKLVPTLVAEMGDAYPQLREKQQFIIDTIKDEEKRFSTTLEHGLKLLEADIAELKGDVIQGETIFKLYDTYGFPVDLTNDIAREQNLTLDMEGFERCMEAQRERARAASNFGAERLLDLQDSEETIFHGYHSHQLESNIATILVDGESVPAVAEGMEAILILTETPFYAEAGGQVGDTGTIIGDGFEFLVKDTKKQQDIFLHIGVVKSGEIKAESVASAKVDHTRRDLIKKNHSATHLLHHALQTVLGDHIEQKGSLVTDDRLRFDFSHNKPVTFEELQNIERLVNGAIRENSLIEINEMPIDAAKERGAMALFGEKYGDVVRVVEMGDSIELCGGTHVSATGDIGLFKVTQETGIAAGVRRIEAVTGGTAVEIMLQQSATLHHLASTLKTDHAHIESRVDQALDEAKSLRKEIAALQSKLVFASRNEILNSAIEIDGIKVIVADIKGADNRSLRELCDNLQAETAGITLLLSEVDGRVALVSGVTKALTDRIKAGELLNAAAQEVGGKGGGRPDSATGGGSEPAHIKKAIEVAMTFIKEKLL
ncbi:alanine--tRNA ligase [Ignatzschineria indica]|uniref:alanine--tRNA ligase n=1 Tax=Ignatzschineria indica TaxID=472583 RepID=UPI002576152C|nr:alanine--tRNA ligase [Ignatzschineria indica]MDM1544548.1 alanine--tRNA ligase [Ignatzschineria indica]